MKTRKHNLNAIALGVTLAIGSMSAQAAFDNRPTVPNPAGPGAFLIKQAELQSTRPSFGKAELAGLCLVESTVSLLASRTNDFGCDNGPNGPIQYDLVIDANDFGDGTAEINGGVGSGNGTTLKAKLQSSDIGTRCHVQLAGGQNKLGSLDVGKYDGDHGWSVTNEIFNSNAFIEIKDSQTQTYNKYKEVNIKNFFARVIDEKDWTFDYGLEDIKKLRTGLRVPTDSDSVQSNSFDPGSFYFPVQKWQELSWYSYENGQEGDLWVKKVILTPRGTGCKITVESHDVFNGSSAFELGATVKVGR